MEPLRLKQQTPPPSRRTTTRNAPPDDFDADEGLYPVKSRTSAVRYVDTQGNQVILRGNQQFILHDEPPPGKRRRPHWLLISGLSMLVLLLLWALLSWLTSWIANNQLNATYEYPRVFQADAVVYPGDTSEHPSHYLFLNLNGTVLIVELPHGDSSKARVYKGPTLFDANADQIPVTGEFRVVNGKVELLVHIQDKVILYVNDGTQFRSQ
jgi:hypothetical protein